MCPRKLSRHKIAISFKIARDLKCWFYFANKILFCISLNAKIQVPGTQKFSSENDMHAGDMIGINYS